MATAPASPAASTVRRGRVSATQKIATRTGTSAAPSIWPNAAQATAPATAKANTAIGRRSRQARASAGSATSR